MPNSQDMSLPEFGGPTNPTNASFYRDYDILNNTETERGHEHARHGIVLDSQEGAHINGAGLTSPPTHPGAAFAAGPTTNEL